MNGFYSPKTIEEAVALLCENPGITILAGGSDIVVSRRLGKIQPSGYLNIIEIEALQCIAIEDGKLFVGSAVTFEHAKECALLKETCPLLCEAAASVGSPQIRSRGTFGGNVMNASPAADTVPAFVAAEAQAIFLSGKGRRSISVEALIEGHGKVAADNDELLLGFYLPLWEPGKKWCFQKIGRRNSLAISRINGACTIDIKDGKIANSHLCIGAATNMPMRFIEAEELLNGNSAADELFKAAGQAVSEKILAVAGRRASSEYKLPVIRDFTAHILRTASET